MIRKKRKPPVEEEPGLDMSSLIDVSFLLLIYFLVTSTLDPKEADLGMTLPTTQASSSDVEIDQMTINVNGEGHVEVNGELLDTDTSSRKMPMLFDRLRQYAEAARLTNSEPVVVISADDSAKGQRFVDVLNTLAAPEVDIRNVTITGFTEE